MTPLFKKLNYKNQANILVLNAPASFDGELHDMAAWAHILKGAETLEAIDFALVFATQQNEVDAAISLLSPKLEGDAVLWFCYPKGSSKKYKCDFNRDTGWAVLGQHGLEPVRQVAIDEDWSALRFRKAEYIRTLTRSESFTMSAEGKKRAKAHADALPKK